MFLEIENIKDYKYIWYWDTDSIGIIYKSYSNHRDSVFQLHVSVLFEIHLNSNKCTILMIIFLFFWIIFIIK